MSCDIFCRVVDNFGDIGVCWRLAREWRARYGCGVRLWCDDPASFLRLCPEAEVCADGWRYEGVHVLFWQANWSAVDPAAWVIEAFACELPPAYVQAMAAAPYAPIWINLEYLSAEPWVEGCHALASPHPQTGLLKYFFFPGFSAATGGLLRERGLLAQRDAFQADAQQQRDFLAGCGVDASWSGRTVSLFAYETPGLAALLSSWARGSQPMRVLVPQGRVVSDVAAFFQRASLAVGEVLEQGALRVQVVPFLAQRDYDRLLWCCDLNFVRGEDSFVRAQWAGRPFVWQIYRQDAEAHHDKLAAFMARFWPAAEDESGRKLWWAWNGVGDVVRAWAEFEADWARAQDHAQAWCAALAEGPELLDSLVEFRKSVLK